MAARAAAAAVVAVVRQATRERDGLLEWAANGVATRHWPTHRCLPGLLPLRPLPPPLPSLSPPLQADSIRARSHSKLCCGWLLSAEALVERQSLWLLLLVLETWEGDAAAVEVRVSHSIRMGRAAVD